MTEYSTKSALFETHMKMYNQRKGPCVSNRFHVCDGLCNWVMQLSKKIKSTKVQTLGAI